MASERWFGGKGRQIERLELADAFALDGTSFIAVARVRYGRGATERYAMPLRLAADGLHLAFSGDATWRALGAAIADGRTLASLPDLDATATTDRAPADAASAPSSVLVCRPASALVDILPAAVPVGQLAERAIGADQSNTSVVLGERLVLKAFRRLEPGLNPDLELNAYLAEEDGFPAVPRLGGYAEIVSREAGIETLALLQEYLPGAADAYEATAEQLAAWVLAPGSVALEFATEEAEELGELTGQLHATLAAAIIPEFRPRPAGHDELRDWRLAADEQLEEAVATLDGLGSRDAASAAEELRTMAPVIAEWFTVFEAVATAPLLIRVHGDYHLGQVLRTPQGLVVIDFEGEPTRPLADRRRPGSPLRDVASMLRSIDHVGRSADRRAIERAGGNLDRVGLDLAAWRHRSRERFLEGYRRVLRAAGAPIVVDEALLLAFEFEKECYEFIYAATYLPSWLWAPLEGMRELVAGSKGAIA